MDTLLVKHKDKNIFLNEFEEELELVPMSYLKESFNPGDYFLMHVSKETIGFKGNKIRFIYSTLKLNNTEVDILLKK